MNKTSIAWATHTANPLRGCSRVSKECDHCYAERHAWRFHGPGQPYEGLVRMTKKGPRWTGKIWMDPKPIGRGLLRPERLLSKAARRGERIFINSTSDLWHPAVPFEFIDRVFGAVVDASQHIHMILTKRPERAIEWAYSTRERTALVERGSHVWTGVSAGTHRALLKRWWHFHRWPSGNKWLSAEPLLEPLQLLRGLLELRLAHSPARPAWVVGGGESGPLAEVCHLEWLEELLADCEDLGIVPFIKQVGRRPMSVRLGPESSHRALAPMPYPVRHPKGEDPDEWPPHLRVRRFPFPV